MAFGKGVVRAGSEIVHEQTVNGIGPAVTGFFNPY
jgi:hypothetical protein